MEEMNCPLCGINLIDESCYRKVCLMCGISVINPKRLMRQVIAIRRNAKQEVFNDIDRATTWCCAAGDSCPSGHTAITEENLNKIKKKHGLI